MFEIGVSEVRRTTMRFLLVTLLILISIGCTKNTGLLPNLTGELYVSMLNPERIFSGADHMRIEIMTIDKRVIAESFPFRF